jgi:hypothetical protein
VNVVWQAFADTTVHAGYSRYFTPPPFELIGSETFAKFAGTSALPPGSETEDTPPIAERADYYDIGGSETSLLGYRRSGARAPEQLPTSRPVRDQQ